MPSGSAPQYETFTPTFPRNSISNHVAGNVASRKMTIKKTRTRNTDPSPSDRFEALIVTERGASSGDAPSDASGGVQQCAHQPAVAEAGESPSS